MCPFWCNGWFPEAAGPVTIHSLPTQRLRVGAEFVNGKRRYQITNQCIADENGRGLRCYYRERVSLPRLAGQMSGVDPMGSSDRIEDERIVEAAADGEQLVVTHLDARGRGERRVGKRLAEQ